MNKEELIQWLKSNLEVDAKVISGYYTSAIKISLGLRESGKDLEVFSEVYLDLDQE